jgi:hypothetical protein
VIFGDHKRPAQSARFSFSPTKRSTWRKTLSQHNGHTIENGKGIQGFADVVQKRSNQQVRFGMTGSLQVLEYPVSVRLLRKLHSTEKDNLG